VRGPGQLLSERAVCGLVTGLMVGVLCAWAGRLSPSVGLLIVNALDRLVATYSHPATMSAESPNPYKVLVADDEPAMLNLVSRYMRSLGFEVIEASEGDAAWDLAQQHSPDLVILDVMMPGMSGWEVCKRLKNHGSNGGQFTSTGVIMLTGIGDNLNEMTSPLFAADAWLNKPFDFNDLEDRVRKTLARYRGARAASEAQAAALSEKPTTERAQKRLLKAAPMKAASKPIKATAKPVKATAKKAATKAAPKSAAKAAPKAAAKKASPAKAKGSSAKKLAAKPAAKRPAAKKPAAKKSAAKKSAAKKSATKKSATKKSAAKR
jgi:DNA-binding response OmpR family regulator